MKSATGFRIAFGFEMVWMLASCGGSDRSNQLAISPESATIPVNSSLHLEVSGSWLVKYTNVVWTVQEEGLSCTTESLPPVPPSVPCPSGWMWEPVPVGNLPRTNATYYSPVSAGIFHVVAAAETESGQKGEVVATITVTP